MIHFVPTPLVTHVWQSTFFAVGIWLLTVSLRAYSPRVRYWLWFAASAKFAIPFGALVSAGDQLAWQVTPIVLPPLTASRVQTFFTSSRIVTHSSASGETQLGLMLMFATVWVVGLAIVLSRWWLDWRRVRMLMRTARPVPTIQALDGRIPMMESPVVAEPALAGLLRPVLLLPEGMLERVPAAQLRALIAHEYSHWRHRDNLTAAIHMAIEAVFWFHPFVWWIERRLLEERERACDEEVLCAGIDPDTYASGILEICRWSVERPFTCAASAGGSRLRERVEAIMKMQVGKSLEGWRRLALVATGVVAVVAPVVTGAVTPRAVVQQGSNVTVPAVAFAAASIKPVAAPAARTWQFLPGGRFIANSVSLHWLVRIAYNAIAPAAVAGGAPWVDRESYDIEAVADAATLPPDLTGTARQDEGRAMLRSLLAERFKLRLHREMREVPAYELIRAGMARGLQPSKKQPAECRDVPRGSGGCHALSGGQARGLKGTGVDLGDLAQVLAVFLDRPVVPSAASLDLFDIDFPAWASLQPTPQQTPLPDVFTMLQEQGGLRLLPTKRSVEVLVIDSAERPSAN